MKLAEAGSRATSSIRRLAGTEVRRGLSVLAVSVLGLALIGCTSARAVRVPAAAATPPPDVVVTEAIARTVPIYTQSVAQTMAVETVNLSAQIAGTIEQLLFKEGTEVKQGQLLFVIDQRPYMAALQAGEAQLYSAQAALQQALQQIQLRQQQATLASLEAALVYDEQQVVRDRYLLGQGAIAQQQLDSDTATEKAQAASVAAQIAVVQDTALSTQIGIEQARAAVQQYEAAVRQAQLNLVYTTIRAPIDGIISLRNVDQGNLVAVNQQLASLTSVDPMIAQFPVSEVTFLEATSHRTGSAVGTAPSTLSFQLILSDGTVYPHPGTYRAVNNAVNAQSGTIQVEAAFPNPERLLRAGMYAQVRVRTEDRPNTVLIPQDAVQEVQGTQTVFVVGPDNTVTVRSITTGGPYGPFFTVLSGVQAGERVIVEGVQKVQPGVKVAPTLRAAPALPPPGSGTG
jgi:membrane fusion protein, multidrug efflux system